MLYHIALDCNRFSKPQLYDSRTQKYTSVRFEGARSYLEDYVNKQGYVPVSIHESVLPDRIQLVCWYRVPRVRCRQDHKPGTKS